MHPRSHLGTVRFAPEEKKRVDSYLKENPIFESFSSLARVATLTFMGQKNQFHLVPVEEGKAGKKPYFIWDYNISDVQFREILKTPGLSAQKQWAIERLLTQARFSDVIRYLDVDEIFRVFPRLKLPQRKKEWWDYALKRWHGKN